MNGAEVKMLERDGAPALAFRKRDGASPTLVFLPGYASDMEGAKAQAIDAFGAALGPSSASIIPAPARRKGGSRMGRSTPG